MSFQKEEKFYFFDCGEDYPYLVKRLRRETETLPAALQELLSSTNTVKASTNVDNFLHKQKRIPLLSNSPNHSKKKAEPITTLDTIKESTGRVRKNKNINKQRIKKNKKLVVSDAEEYHEIEEEDDGKFLFEEAKFSATTIISQLGKLLDVIAVNYKAEPAEVKSQLKQPQLQPLTHQQQDSIATKDSDVIWKFEDSISNLKATYKSKNFVPSDAIEDLLDIDYSDLIKNTEYRNREWQTHTYRHIVGSSVKPTDSGIFSTPATAMSGLYIKTTRENSAKNKRSKLFANGEAAAVAPSMSLQRKPSYDSGLTSDAESIFQGCAFKADSKHFKRSLNTRTRLERFAGYEDSKQNEDAEFFAAGKKKQSKEEVKSDEVPVPPITPATINFAISSRTCHEKGWVIQPSLLQDAEHRTLLLWARERLVHAMKQRLEEEEEFLENNLKPIEVRYYGDTKKNVTIKYKRGTAIAKQMEKNPGTKQQTVFMITMRDHSFVIFYPSRNIAVSAVSCPDSDGLYILVYSDDSYDKKLLAYFTPSGRGVCHHSNGRPAFVSMAKFGCCQDEYGALINKWKWTMHKMVPPLSFHINPKILFRCSNKQAMSMLVSINGESIKINIGSKMEVPDPILDEMGKLLTKAKFSSNVAIQLSRFCAISKKKKESRKGRSFNRHTRGYYGRSNTASVNVLSTTTIPDDVLEQRMKDLQIKFPIERQAVEMCTSYQLELQTLQRKFKTTVADWLDHYRIATGMKSPIRSLKKPIKKSQTCSALSLPARMPSSSHQLKVIHEKKVRTPSAPPISQTDRSRISFDVRPRPHSSDCYRVEPETLELIGESGRKPPSIGAVQSTHSSFKCGLLQMKSKSTVTLPKEGCPVALRKEIFGETSTQCRCDNRKVPVLTDVELDYFLNGLPKTQLVVISLVNNSTSTKNPADRILEKLYKQLNKNRSIPCVQARHDPYRLFRYAVQNTSGNRPILISRHNVVPGMFMMYQGGKLLFADYIFDGYGSTKRDFLRQISRTRKEALKGRYLPEDFQFNPSTACMVDPLHPPADVVPSSDTAFTVAVEESIAKKDCKEKEGIFPVKINIVDCGGLRIQMYPSSISVRPSDVSVRPSDVSNRLSDVSNRLSHMSNLKPSQQRL